MHYFVRAATQRFSSSCPFSAILIVALSTSSKELLIDSETLVLLVQRDIPVFPSYLSMNGANRQMYLIGNAIATCSDVFSLPNEDFAADISSSSLKMDRPYEMSNPIIISTRPALFCTDNEIRQYSCHGSHIAHALRRICFAK